MAKVRIQARSGDVDDVIETSDEHPHQKQVKHAGAVEILARVWKREGFTGWYQVCRITSSAMLLVIQWTHIAGNASSNYKSGVITSTSLHVKRAVRALGSCHHDHHCTTPIEADSMRDSIIVPVIYI